MGLRAAGRSSGEIDARADGVGVAAGAVDCHASFEAEREPVADAAAI